MDVLKSWVESFSLAGIRLVFFFDGVVGEQKRQEWVRKETINLSCSNISFPKTYFACCDSTHLRIASVERLSLVTF